MEGSSVVSHAHASAPTLPTLRKFADKPASVTTREWQLMLIAFRRAGGLRTSAEISEFLARQFKKDVLPTIVRSSLQAAISARVASVARRWARFEARLARFVRDSKKLAGIGSRRTAPGSLRHATSSHSRRNDEHHSGAANVDFSDIPRHMSVIADSDHSHHHQAAGVDSALGFNSGGSQHHHSHHASFPHLSAHERAVEAALINERADTCRVAAAEYKDAHLAATTGVHTYDAAKDDGLLSITQFALLIDRLVDADGDLQLDPSSASDGDDADTLVPEHRGFAANHQGDRRARAPMQVAFSSSDGNPREESQTVDAVAPTPDSAAVASPDTRAAKGKLPPGPAVPRVAQDVFDALVEEEMRTWAEGSLSNSRVPDASMSVVNSRTLDVILGEFGIVNEGAVPASPERVDRVGREGLAALFAIPRTNPFRGGTLRPLLDPSRAGNGHRTLQLDADDALDDELVMQRATPQGHDDTDTLNGSDATPLSSTAFDKKASGLRKLRTLLAFTGLGRKGSALTMSASSPGSAFSGGGGSGGGGAASGALQRLDSKKSVASAQSGGRLSRKSSLGSSHQGGTSRTATTTRRDGSNASGSGAGGKVLRDIDDVVSVRSDSENETFDARTEPDELRTTQSRSLEATGTSPKQHERHHHHHHHHTRKRKSRTVALQTDAESFTKLWLGPLVSHRGVGTRDPEHAGEIGTVVSLSIQKRRQQVAASRARELAALTDEAKQSPTVAFVLQTMPDLTPSDAFVAFSHSIDEIRELTRGNAEREVRLLEAKYEMMNIAARERRHELKELRSVSRVRVVTDQL